MLVVSVTRQLARLKLGEREALHNYFIRAQELSRKFEHAKEHFSEPLLTLMVHNGLPECYEHCSAGPGELQSCWQLR